VICDVCGFKASKTEQIEWHHPDNIDSGPKNKRNPVYYNTPDLKPLYANCHSLEHRTGGRLLEMCGQWHRRLPGNQKYKDPGLIFSNNCPETYRVQKTYYLKWHLTSSDQYKCQKCGVVHWGKDKKLLSLELHHVDRNHTNSQIDNLELLCPNCHRLY
jgi:predicted HNH restriction endonuclease